MLLHWLLSAATFAAGPGAPGISVPIHALAGGCQDPRYPALAGPWIVGCSKRQVVDLAISLETGQKVPLPDMRAPGLSNGVVYSPEHGRIVLDRPDETKLSRFQRSRFKDRIAPPAVGVIGFAVVKTETLDVLPEDGKVIRKIGGNGVPLPLGWQPPAIAGDRVAWVVDAGEHGADIWWVPLAGGIPEPLSTGPGDQHHVTAQGQWLTWVAPDGVVVLDTVTDTRVSYPAATGFSAGPTLWQGVACWETREGADVDIACSDGQGVDGAGHQRYPSRWDQWILYREAGTVFLHTLETP